MRIFYNVKSFIKNKEVVFSFLIVLSFFISLRHLFFGPAKLFTDDLEVWYAISSIFMESLYNGFIPLWNPFVQGGEPLYPAFGLFRLSDPLYLFLIICGKLFNIPIFNLYHLQFIIRVFTSLIGVYLLFREINKTFPVNLILFLLFSLYLVFSLADAIYMIFCWFPYILWFLIRFFKKENIKDYLFSIYFLGLYVGAASYHMATGTFLIFCFVLMTFIFNPSLFYLRLKYLFLKKRFLTILSFIFIVLMSLPLLSTFLTAETELYPVARTCLNRDTFINNTDFSFTYEEMMQDGCSLTRQEIFEKIKAFPKLPTTTKNLPLTLCFLPISIIGLFFNNNKWKSVFLALMVIIFFFLLGTNTPIHKVYTIMYFPLRYVRQLHFVVPMLLFCYLYFIGLGLEILYFKFLRYFKYTTYVTYFIIIIFLFVFILRPSISSLGTPEKFKPDFSHYAEKINFVHKRIFALPRTHWYVMEPTLYKKNTALHMLAASPEDISPEETDYFKTWDKLKTVDRTGATYGLRSIYWTKNYYKIYLLGERDIRIFNALMGVDQDIIDFREKSIVASDEEVRDISELLGGELFSMFLNNYVIISSDNYVNNIEKLDMSSLSYKLSQVLSSNIEFSYSVARYDYNHIELIVDNKKDGILIYRDGFSKDWKSWVNGKQAEVLRVNVGFKGVQLKNGKNKVVFKYKPNFYLFSMWQYIVLSIITLPFLIMVKFNDKVVNNVPQKLDR